jgi:hypothetical protein
MAESNLVLCDVLCYLFNNWDKVPAKPLKDSLLDYFTPSELSVAKHVLLEHTKLLKESSILPYIPRRREGEGFVIKEIDDIFVILHFLDENKLFSSLPKFVTDKPNNIPSGRIFEGDLRFMVDRLDKLDDTLKTTLSAILHELSQVRALYVSKVVTSEQSCVCQQSQDKGVNNSLASHNVQVTKSGSNQKVTSEEWGFPTTTTTVTQPVDKSVNGLQSTVNWAAATSHLAQQSLDDTDGDTGDFTLSINKKKRRRIQRAQHQKSINQTSPTNQTGNEINDITTKSKNFKPLLIGKKKSVSSNGQELKAAIRRVSKRVFCIDNLDTSITTSALTSFVSSLNVTVISCFNVQPRRSASQKLSYITPTNRNAFRLCVPREDVDRLLDADFWPSDVTISKWFLKKKTDEHTNEHMDDYAESVGDIPHDEHHSEAAAGESLIVPSTSGAAGAASFGTIEKSVLSTLLSNFRSGQPSTECEGTTADDCDNGEDGDATILLDHDTDFIKNGD